MKHGGVFNTDASGYLDNKAQISTENIGGLIFDIANYKEALAGTVFANEAVVELNTVSDVEDAGLTGNVAGILAIAKYHIDKFFKIAGEPSRLFVMFADLSAGFEAIEAMQTAAHGVIDHLGVWTERDLFVKDGTAMAVAPFLKEIQKQAEVVGGSIRQKNGNYINYDGNSPLVVLVNANTAHYDKGYAVDVKALPNAIAEELPLVAVLIGQESSDDVHALQAANTNFCPVGNIGAAIGVLAVAPVENSIGWVGGYDLAVAGIKKAELGFGNNTVAEGGKPSVDTFVFTSIDSLPYYKRNSWVCEKGYIMLTDYEEMENSVFFSNDETLSDTDFNSISLVRTIHKSRRIVRKALLPRVNQKYLVNSSTGLLPSGTITDLQNTVINAIDNGMVDPGSTDSQISGRKCTINSNQNVLKTHNLDIVYAIVPVGTVQTYTVTEHFANTTA